MYRLGKDKGLDIIFRFRCQRKLAITRKSKIYRCTCKNYDCLLLIMFTKGEVMFEGTVQMN